MSKLERTERIKALSRIALGLARGAGIQGYIELEGNRFGVYDFTDNAIAIEHLRTVDAGVPSTLIVRHLGAKVLSIEWVSGRVLKTSFKPGEWEARLFRCGQFSARVSDR